MYFLVDFENVRSNGLRGAEYLDKNDYLTLFYSSAAHSCENRYLEEIEQSGCVFDTCKLVKSGKNGLVKKSMEEKDYGYDNMPELRRTNIG